MDKASFFILNIFLNSLLAFFTTVLLIEGIVFLFRIRQGRIAAVLRMIPILKLPLDLFLYDFTRWAYVQGINPLYCEEGTRSLSVFFGWIDNFAGLPFLSITSGIQMLLPGNITFTLADTLCHLTNPLLLNLLASSLLLVTFVLFTRKCILFYQSKTALNALEKSAETCLRKIENSILISSLTKYPLRISTLSTLKGSPFVAGLISPLVYIPQDLSQELSKEEYEAVLAHEIEHIRNKDNWSRLILDLIRSIFWWIPLKWLYARIEEGQEIGCDLKCQKYGIQPVDLATAISKSARHSRRTAPQVLIHLLTKESIHMRLHLLLESPTIPPSLLRSLFSALAVGIAFFLIFLGRYWIF